MSARVRPAALVGVAFALMIAMPASAQPKGAPAATVTCDILEITATSGKDASVAPELQKLQKKFKKPPFSSWNQFTLMMSDSRALKAKRTEIINLKLGSATATLVEIVDTSKVRLMVTIGDASGKQIVNNKSTVEAGDYLVYGHSLPNNDGHLLALTCR